MTDRGGPVERAIQRGFRSMVRRGLRGVWLRGDLPGEPFVWAANHHSWWDPFLAAVLLDSRPACLVMLQENLNRYRFVRRLGVFGTAEHRQGLEFLRDGRVLVIYPERELRAAGPLGDLADGAAWYARRSGVPLRAVASRVAIRGHEAAEAYLWSAAVPTFRTLRDTTRRLAETLSSNLSQMDAALAGADPRQPLPGFRLVVPGRRSWDERLDALGRWRR